MDSPPAPVAVLVVVETHAKCQTGFRRLGRWCTPCHFVAETRESRARKTYDIPLTLAVDRDQHVIVSARERVGLPGPKRMRPHHAEPAAVEMDEIHALVD